MRVLVIDHEEDPAGHHGVFFEAVISEAISRNWSVTAAVTEQGSVHPNVSRVLACERSARLQTVVTKLKRTARIYRGTLLGSQFGSWDILRQFGRVLQRHDSCPDIAYIVNCDDWYLAAAILGSPLANIRVATTIFKLRFFHEQLGIASNRSWVRNRLQQVALERLLNHDEIRAMLTSDESCVAADLQSKGRAWSKMHYVPEIAQVPDLIPRADARHRLGLQASRRIVLCYGSLSLRKGIPELLNAIDDPSCPSDIDVLLIGEVRKDLQSFLDSGGGARVRHSGRVRIVPGYYDSTTLALALSAADIVWVGYRNHAASSAILWEAAIAGLPVIACDEALVGYWTRRHRLGAVVNVHNVTSILKALEVLTGGGQRQRAGLDARALHGREHSASAYGRSVCDVLLASAGAGASPEVACQKRGKA